MIVALMSTRFQRVWGWWTTVRKVDSWRFKRWPSVRTNDEGLRSLGTSAIDLFFTVFHQPAQRYSAVYQRHFTAGLTLLSTAVQIVIGMRAGCAVQIEQREDHGRRERRHGQPVGREAAPEDLAAQVVDAVQLTTCPTRRNAIYGKVINARRLGPAVFPQDSYPMRPWSLLSNFYGVACQRAARHTLPPVLAAQVIHAVQLRVRSTWSDMRRNAIYGKVNAFTPKLKKYILPTFQREMYNKWGGEKLIV